MYAQIVKPKENLCQAADFVGQKKSNVKQSFGFVGNRAIPSKAKVENCGTIYCLPIQRVTNITDSGTQAFPYKPATGSNTSENVGKKIVADLDKDYPKVGTETTGQEMDKLFTSLNTHYSGMGGWMRGHLLNHDLGGRAIKENLFPITTSANKEHQYEVEGNVKKWLFGGAKVRYSIEAKRTSTDALDPSGQLDCQAEVTSPGPGDAYKNEKIRKIIKATTSKQTVNRSDGSQSSEPRHSQVEVGGANTAKRYNFLTNQVPSAWLHKTEASLL